MGRSVKFAFGVLTAVGACFISYWLGVSPGAANEVPQVLLWAAVLALGEFTAFAVFRLAGFFERERGFPVPEDRNDDGAE